MNHDNVGKMRKITVRLPKDLLEQVQAYTGQGVTETVRAALKCLVPPHAPQQPKALAGKKKSSLRVKQTRD